MKILAFDIGIKNLAFSIVEKINDNFKIIDCGLIDLNEQKKCKKCNKPSAYFLFDEIEMIYCCKGHAEEFEKTKKIKDKTIDELCKIICNKFDNIFNNLEVDNIIIENQPSFRAPKIKSLQCFIMMYFIMKNKNTKFQNPCCSTFNKKFKEYKDKKKFAILLCEKILDEQDYKNFISENKKKDDLCDATLHAIYKLNDGNPPEKIKQLLDN